jgi:hypothetical protein
VRLRAVSICGSARRLVSANEALAYGKDFEAGLANLKGLVEK